MDQRTITMNEEEIKEAAVAAQLEYYGTLNGDEPDMTDAIEFGIRKGREMAQAIVDEKIRNMENSRVVEYESVSDLEDDNIAIYAIRTLTELDLCPTK